VARARAEEVVVEVEVVEAAVEVEAGVSPTDTPRRLTTTVGGPTALSTSHGGREPAAPQTDQRSPSRMKMRTRKPIPTTTTKLHIAKRRAGAVATTKDRRAMRIATTTP
jgi:hypothetical protein